MADTNVIASTQETSVVVGETTSTLPPYPPPRVSGGGAAAATTTIKMKYLTQLDVGHAAAGRINAWIESMRASSPTRAMAAAAASAGMDGERATRNIRRLPSALSHFQDIVGKATGKQVVMFLDYDGTLSPIVDDPDLAFMSATMRDAVKSVARYFPTAIVSGRRRDKVYNFVRLAELYYAGSHGMDIKVPAKCSKHIKTKVRTAVVFQPASEFIPVIDEVYKLLCEKTKSIAGSKVENNKFCVSVHYRCVDEKNWSAVVELVKSVIQRYPALKLRQGRMVFDIRPSIKWDKGKALEFLLESLGFVDRNDVLPVYIGDDRTDEDAFKVLRQRGQGIGILVSKNPKETLASYSLQEPSEVMNFLLKLVKWKRIQ